jgi:hypothetical protein
VPVGAIRLLGAGECVGDLDVTPINAKHRVIAQVIMVAR